MIKIYGIKNCDTMKKTMSWLTEHNIPYSFHDYKKEGANDSALDKAISVHGWENVINRRGTSWRKLDDAVKENMNENTAKEAAIENPSLIKRPLITTANDDIILGFDEDSLHLLL